MTKPLITVLAVAAILTGCAAPVGPGAGSSASERAGVGGSPGHVLTIATRYEVTRLFPKVADVADPYPTIDAFNASLALSDDTGSIRPYLAEIPQLNSDTWRVFPDGRMETTYKLRPNLTWQDGDPLEAEDWVFAHRVYASPSLTIFPSRPQNQMESVLAADARTLVIRWRGPYPYANSIQEADLDPLPRHILSQPFASLEQEAGGADAFLSHPFWRSGYIGAGPYKLVQWEPGSHFEGVAFDGYVLGRPQIDRIVIRIIGDDTVILTNILAGALDWGELRAEGGRLLERDWVAAGKGSVGWIRGNNQYLVMQLRPEYVGHPAQLDVRVRRAIAHSLDRKGINDGVFEGQGFMTETIIPVTESFYPEVDRVITHYPYDPRRSEQLMNEGGFAKDREGVYANAAGERFGFDFQRVNGSEAEQAQLILTDAWRRAGFEVRPSLLPPAQLQSSGEHRHTYPGLQGRGGGTEQSWLSAEIGTPENRWVGSNSAAWSSPEYDRLYDAVNTTLDPTDRIRQFAQMQRLLTEQLPGFYMYFGKECHAYPIALHGPKGETTAIGSFTQRTLRNYNIHEWEWR